MSTPQLTALVVASPFVFWAFWFTPRTVVRWLHDRKLKEAARATEKAAMAYKDAWLRRDARDKGHKLKAFVDAKTRQLEIELGR